jgi:hypothetical protein
MDLGSLVRSFADDFVEGVKGIVGLAEKRVLHGE